MAYVYYARNVTTWRDPRAGVRLLAGKFHVTPHPLAKAPLRCSAARAATNGVKNTTLSGLMTVLQEDSANLFTDQGMDLSIYAPDVDFQDPITDYSDVQVCFELL